MLCRQVLTLFILFNFNAIFIYIFTSFIYHLRPSPPISAHLRPSPPISAHFRPSPPISAHLRPSPPISAHLRPSPPISVHLCPSPSSFYISHISSFTSSFMLCREV